MGVEIARTLAEQSQRHHGEAFLARRIERGPSAKRELDRDERHRMLFDEPRLDALRRDHALDGRRARRDRHEQDEEQDRSRPAKPPGERTKGRVSSSHHREAGCR